jgi:hypothetical protein
LSAPELSTSRASSNVRIPPATQKGTSITRATSSTHLRETRLPSALAAMS